MGHLNHVKSADRPNMHGMDERTTGGRQVHNRDAESTQQRAPVHKTAALVVRVEQLTFARSEQRQNELTQRAEIQGTRDTFVESVEKGGERREG